MTRLWHAFTAWLESGDLVPLLVIVSAAHYVKVLSGKDDWYIAVPLGILIDLGVYRSVIIAARYNGDNRRQRARGPDRIEVRGDNRPHDPERRHRDSATSPR